MLTVAFLFSVLKNYAKYTWSVEALTGLQQNELAVLSKIVWKVFLATRRSKPFV